MGLPIEYAGGCPRLSPGRAQSVLYCMQARPENIVPEVGV